MRFFTTLIGVLVCIHLVTCFWYLSARLDDFNPNTWVVRGGYQDEDIGTLYLVSLYWAITTLTSVGYGDITAYTNTERFMALI